ETMREEVDLCTSSSPAISVIPACPVRAMISRIVTARSTDWTAPEAGWAASETGSLLLISKLLRTWHNPTRGASVCGRVSAVGGPWGADRIFPDGAEHDEQWDPVDRPGSRDT